MDELCPLPRPPPPPPLLMFILFARGLFRGLRCESTKHGRRKGALHPSFANQSTEQISLGYRVTRFSCPTIIQQGPTYSQTRSLGGERNECSPLNTANYKYQIGSLRVVFGN